MSVKLPTEHHLEFKSLKGCCTGSYESILVKMPHRWKPHVTAHLYYSNILGEGSAGKIYLCPWWPWLLSILLMFVVAPMYEGFVFGSVL